MSMNKQKIHCVALYVNSDKVMYLDSFGAEYIPKEIGKLVKNKHIY